MEFTNNYDAKIMGYTGENLEEFIALFTEEEIEEMREYVESCDWDFSDTDNPTEWDILSIYIKEWLVDNIRFSIVDGTKHLLRLLYAF